MILLSGTWKPMAWKKRDVMASADVAICGLVSGSNLMKKRRLLASRNHETRCDPLVFGRHHSPFAAGGRQHVAPGTRFNSATVIFL